MMIEILFLLVMSVILDTSITMLRINIDVFMIYILAMLVSIILSIVHTKFCKVLDKHTLENEPQSIKSALTAIALLDVAVNYNKKNINAITISIISLFLGTVGALFSIQLFAIIFLLTVSFYLMFEIVYFNEFKNIIKQFEREEFNWVGSVIDSSGNELTEEQTKEFFDKLTKDLKDDDDK